MIIKPKLLIVDDVPNNIHALKRILSVLDIEIVGVNSGQDALAEVLEQDFFIVLMDVQMPEMDGFEAAELMFNNPRTSHIPVIFLTAISKEEKFVIKGYEVGAVDYMTKPINADILLSKIKIFLRIYQKEQEFKFINQKLDKFSRTAAHDLKAPLRHIYTFAQMLAEDYQDKKIDTEGAELIKSIQDASTRMKTLIEDLLAYAKMVEIDAPKDDVDLNIIVKEVLSDLEGVLKEKEGKVEVDQLPNIAINSMQIRQIFQNLLSNAIKYSKPDVAPIINVKYKEFGDEDMQRDSDRNVCKIIVQDNGIGFDEAHSEKIFSPFERLVDKNEYEGTGVGLATVKEIVDANRGTIEAKSVLGEGSTFTVTLPLKKNRE